MIKHWVVWRLKPNTGCNDVSLTHLWPEEKQEILRYGAATIH